MSNKYLEFGINATYSVTMYCGFQKPCQCVFHLTATKVPSIVETFASLSPTALWLLRIRAIKCAVYKTLVFHIPLR